MTCVKQLLNQIEHTKLATLPDASLTPAASSNAADPFGEESKGVPVSGVGDDLDFLSDAPPRAAAQASMAAFATPTPAPTPAPAPAGPAFKSGIADPFNAPARKPTAPVAAAASTASASADPFANIGGAQNINANTLFANLGGGGSTT